MSESLDEIKKILKQTAIRLDKLAISQAKSEEKIDKLAVAQANTEKEIRTSFLKTFFIILS